LFFNYFVVVMYMEVSVCTAVCVYALETLNSCNI